MENETERSLEQQPRQTLDGEGHAIFMLQSFANTPVFPTDYKLFGFTEYSFLMPR